MRKLGTHICHRRLIELPSPSLLVLVGYYFTSGPWKKLWVKFGYDPRSDPSSKKYQCLDFRLPKDVGTAGLEETARSLSGRQLFVIMWMCVCLYVCLCCVSMCAQLHVCVFSSECVCEERGELAVLQIILDITVPR